MNIKSKRAITAEKIASLIQSGEFPPGSKLPRGTEFARELGVSHITLRGALEDLAKEGFVTSVHGKGTFVTSSAQCRAAGKILIIRDHFHSLRNSSNYILPGFEKRCCELQLLTETLNTQFIANITAETFRRTLKKNNFTGIMLPGGGFRENDPLALMLRESRLPVLIAHGTAMDKENTPFHLMRTNYAAAWDDGVRFLRSCGKKRIAFLGNRLFRVKYYTDEEFLAHFALHGAASEKELIAFCTHEKTSFITAVEGLLKSSPEAIFCGSDFLATLVCEFLTERKIHIPRQIAVLGFGGYPGGNFCPPPLSTVDFQYNAIGERAAELLAAPENLTGQRLDIFTPHKILCRESAIKIK
jgi:DNA-binding LacI/PurR family transcriptional regulator